MSEHASPASSPSPGRPAGDDPHQAPALDYGAFRRMADWSAGMVDERVVFHYGAQGELTANTPIRTPQLQVPVLNLGRVRRVESLQLVAGTGGVELADHTDAAFWSEAAVEKFVLPYYASLGAGSAAAVLAQLLGAWAGPPMGVQVLALTHFAHPPEPGSTTVADTLGVVYAQDGAPPRRATLARFLADHRPDLLRPTLSVPNPAPPAPREMPQPHANAWALPAYPTYLEMRVMAEWSSSLRGAPAYFVYDTTRRPDPENPYANFRPFAELPDGTETSIVIPAYTEPLVKDRPPVLEMNIKPRILLSRVQDLVPRADAVFWSTGAVEHLLMPYYAQVYGGQALRQVQQMHDVWWEHRPAAEGEADGGGARTEVYALLHLPNSDWTTETAHSVADVTGVVFADGTQPGETQVLTLREFLRRPR